MVITGQVRRQAVSRGEATKLQSYEATKSTASDAERIIIMPRKGVHYLRLSAAKSINKATKLRKTNMNA